jgi:hypothetical protein
MEDEEVAWCGKTGKKSVFASGDETRFEYGWKFGGWLEGETLELEGQEIPNDVMIALVLTVVWSGRRRIKG